MRVQAVLGWRASLAVAMAVSLAGCPSGPSRGDHLRRCEALEAHLRAVLGSADDPAVTWCVAAVASAHLRKAWVALGRCALGAHTPGPLRRCLDTRPVRGAFEAWQALARVRALIAAGQWEEAWQACFGRYRDMRALRAGEPVRAQLGEERYRVCAGKGKAILARLEGPARAAACRSLLSRSRAGSPRPFFRAVGEGAKLPALEDACRRP